MADKRAAAKKSTPSRSPTPTGRARFSTQVDAEVQAELDRVEATALAAPFPMQVSIPEFNDG